MRSINTSVNYVLRFGSNRLGAQFFPRMCKSWSAAPQTGRSYSADTLCSPTLPGVLATTSPACCRTILAPGLGRMKCGPASELPGANSRRK